MKVNSKTYLTDHPGILILISMISRPLEFTQDFSSYMLSAPNILPSCCRLHETIKGKTFHNTQRHNRQSDKDNTLWVLLFLVLGILYRIIKMLFYCLALLINDTVARISMWTLWNYPYFCSIRRWSTVVGASWFWVALLSQGLDNLPSWERKWIPILSRYPTG